MRYLADSNCLDAETTRGCLTLKLCAIHLESAVSKRNLLNIKDNLTNLRNQKYRRKIAVYLVLETSLVVSDHFRTVPIS